MLSVTAAPSESTSTDAVEVVGLKGLLSNMAKCCNPTPGDQIVGYITRGRRATIHRQDCPNILLLKDRVSVSFKWIGGHAVDTFPVPIQIKAYDRQGLMGDISNLLDGEGVNIVDVGVKVSRSLADLNLVVEISLCLSQLSRILTRIEFSRT